LARGRLGRARGRDEAVAELWRNLAVLLEAGVPLAEALEVCARQHSGSIQAVLRQILEAVRGGRALSEALALHGRWFDDLTLAVVRVGQRSGALGAALTELAEYRHAGGRSSTV